jgi:hypothetical protein
LRLFRKRLRHRAPTNVHNTQSTVAQTLSIHTRATISVTPSNSSCASARRYTVILRGIEATKQECTSPIGETRMLDLGSAALLMVERELWHRLIYFNLRAHFLDLRGLLFKLGREGLNFPLLLRNRSLELVLQPFHFAVFFEEFIEQHRIHLVVADGIRLSVDR